MADSGDGAEQAFRELVNMDAAALRRWLETEESRSVGWVHDGEAEAVGHQSGRQLLEILERGYPTEAEGDFLRKVVGTVRRHLAQRPEGDIEQRAGATH